MPHKLTLAGWFYALINSPWDTAKIIIILCLGEAGRWMYGGGKFRERMGDLIICLLIFFMIRPHIASLPAIYGVKISPGAIAIVIVLIGAHGIKQILAFFLKKKTGIDINNLGNK